MFNLLVSGASEAWEGDGLSASVSRFKEYSGSEADAISLQDPESLRRLEEIPTLLMYEVGVGGPNARIVRHGRLRDILRRGNEITFTFEPDPQRAFLNRGVILEYADQLGMHSFEQHRTHWAIKDGELPPGLLDSAVPDRPQRTVAEVAAEYLRAKQEGTRREVRELQEELETFPPSLEKALSLLPARILQDPTPELYPILGVTPHTPEARTALEAVLARDSAREGLPSDWPYSLSWFLDLYGSPTESVVLSQAVEACAQHLLGLGAEGGMAPPPVEEVAMALWRCGRSTRLVGQLRREIGVLTGRLARRQAPEGFWTDLGEDGVQTPSVRGTALATVALQR